MFFEINDDIEQAVDIDARDKLGQTPLHLALRYMNTDISELLLRRDADPNLADAEGSTPLHIICMNYSDNTSTYDSVEMIFELSNKRHQPIKVNARDNLGNTPLHFASGFGDRGSIELLMSHGADPNAANSEGCTPLHYICKRDQYDDDGLAEVFLKITKDQQQMVQVDAKDKKGRTPLQLAVANILPNTVDVLLNNGADLSSFVFPDDSYFGEELDPRSPSSDAHTAAAAADPHCFWPFMIIIFIKKKNISLIRHRPAQRTRGASTIQEEARLVVVVHDVVY
ncbi:unnamed protein product [Trichogramma brassicae]|uniref:Uncharacterized protein n=1 Tax=Trichogramma brassicae TaxID=86971 RepID=A0A6H5IRS1_9HYME|nr:unnamed protein product [Trichogramma brassicae]